MNSLRLELHLFLLAEGNLATRIVDLFHQNASLLPLFKVLHLVLVKVNEQLVHDLLRLGIVYCRLLFAWQRSLPLARLNGAHWVHESLDRLLVFLNRQTR